jgi:Tol biopolymer transport system component
MATRLPRRLVPLALLAGVLAAVPGPHDGARAAVPGTNGRIAFVRSAGAGPLEEVFMASPGAAPGPAVNLTNDPLTSDTAPSWSPDGTRVAFQRSGPADGIWVLEVAAGTMSLVPHTEHGFQPTWSPDGTRIAFTREGAGGTTSIRVLAVGGGQLAVTPAGGFDQAPDWSPDGKRLAFNRFLPGEGNRVFTVAPSGKGLTQVTFGGGPTAFNDVHPAWSPDGGRIAFARGGDQDDGLPFHIHTVGLASGRTTQVTGGRVQDLLPSWQPL